jgi:uncharacterized protein YecE (DUF72 family)
MAQASLFQSGPRSTRIRVGPAGWHYKDWEGIVYPPRAGKSFDPLSYLADYCDTIEINSSFYAPPRPEDAAAWARRVANNPRFRFTAKAWSKLTHERKDEESLATDCEEVRRSLAPISDRGLLGALLIQFPWSFRSSPENLKYLEKLLRLLGELPLVLEVRHASWEDPQFYSFLQEQRAGFCNIDQPLIGKSVRLSAHVTSAIGYFRLHGRNYRNWFKENAGRDARYDYLYSKPEIRHIAHFVQQVSEHAEETYVIANNHFRGQALVNAIDLLQELDASPPAVPPLLAEAYPHLRGESAAP